MRQLPLIGAQPEPLRILYFKFTMMCSLFSDWKQSSGYRVLEKWLVWRQELLFPLILSLGPFVVMLIVIAVLLKYYKAYHHNVVFKEMKRSYGRHRLTSHLTVGLHFYQHAINSHAH